MSKPDPAPFVPADGGQPIPPAPWRLFGTRPFFKLWLAQVFSSLGDWVGFLAIVLITSRVSNGSAAALSLVIAVRMVPGFFLATVGGVIVDRFDRRKVMIACDLGRAALISLLPFVNSLPPLVIASFVIEIFTLLWGPAKDASVPHFVPEENLSSANSLSLFASYGTFVPAALISAALTVVAGWLGTIHTFASLKVDREALALWFDAITYITSAVIVFGLPIPRPHRGEARRFDWSETLRDIREGIAFIRSDRFARAVILGLGGGIIGAGAMVPLGTVFAQQVLGSSAQFFVLMVALGTGAAIGLFAILTLRERLSIDVVFEMSVIGAGSFLVLAVSFNVAAIAILLVAVLGACAVGAYVSGFTLLQENTSDELRGRTFATLYAVVRLCLLLALTVAPLSADVFNWILGSLDARQLVIGSFAYSFGGFRVALWVGGLITILSGLYARRELQAVRRDSSRSAHPAESPRRLGPVPDPPTAESA
ncbi:MAG TPA: MFS transporter [Acidimicrobiia bacterium]